MLYVVEGIDDGDCRPTSELQHVGVPERPVGECVAVPREDAGGVSDRFAFSEMDILVRKEDRVSPEVVDPDLEGRARPGGRLLEDHPEVLSGEGGANDSPVSLALEPRGSGEERGEVPG